MCIRSHILERQIVRALARECRSRSCGRSSRSCLVSSRSYRLSHRRREGSCGLGSIEAGSRCRRSCYRSIGIIGLYTPGTNGVEPTALVIVGIDIETDSQQLTDLDIELLNAINSKNLKGALPWVLFHGLDNIGCNFPFRASTLRDSSALGQHGNNLTRNIHFSILFGG